MHSATPSTLEQLPLQFYLTTGHIQFGCFDRSVYSQCARHCALLVYQLRPEFWGVVLSQGDQKKLFHMKLGEYWRIQKCMMDVAET